jgi:hypothetical protein
MAQTATTTAIAVISYQLTVICEKEKRGRGEEEKRRET